MNSETDEPGVFEHRARALLAESVERLPAAVRSRLTQARYAALEGRGSRQRSLVRRWAPAGAGAFAVAVIALMLTVMPQGEGPAMSPTGPFSTAAPDDLEMLADSDGVPLNGEQDLDNDFYEWAASEANGGGPSVGT
ncbi:MAG TPA: DUF3619 family protein [Steroidobacteraceae bacterium]|jgi:hypothetical protein